VAGAESSKPRREQQDPAWVRFTLTLAAATVVVLLIGVPVVHVFWQAFGNGIGAYFHALFGKPATRHAILLTLIVAPTAVLLNVLFGVAAAWALARFRFRGRSVLLALIDLPFAVSPVVAGLVFVLVFGARGPLGPWMRRHGLTTVVILVGLVAVWLCWLGARAAFPGRVRRVRLLTLSAAVIACLVGWVYLRQFPRDPGFRILFATPGLILATAFVTFPLVARELLPVMEATGPDEELAALSLGATGWQTFWRVTLPNIKWGLLYGVILCNARAMGEFGAVYVVSGHITGRTDTMPLRVEKLFQDYETAESFALASLLTLLALVTLVVKVLLERREIRTPPPGPLP
jgi:sulfate transport system permease protein